MILTDFKLNLEFLANTPVFWLLLLIWHELPFHPDVSSTIKVKKLWLYYSNVFHKVPLVLRTVDHQSKRNLLFSSLYFE